MTDADIPLSRAPVNATMTVWMTVSAFGEECLFGFADWHPTTGGLSWMLSTAIQEMTPAADRARTASGRIYSLGREISFADLSEEGRVALRLLLTSSVDAYPGQHDDVAWVTAQKVARHLDLTPPPRSNPVAVGQYLRQHHEAYLARRVQLLRSDGRDA